MQHLSDSYPERCIDRGRIIPWLSGSPDASPIFLLSEGTLRRSLIPGEARQNELTPDNPCDKIVTIKQVLRDMNMRESTSISHNIFRKKKTFTSILFVYCKSNPAL